MFKDNENCIKQSNYDKIMMPEYNFHDCIFIYFSIKTNK